MLVYFDCFSGISGDMTLGAFIDLGVPVKWLKDALCKIPLTGFDLSVVSIFRNGIKAKSVRVDVENNVKSMNYAEIVTLITGSSLSQNTKVTSLEIFKKLANAEAGIHGCSLEKVHFHEVGGIDAIVDITGAALCVEYLDIKKITASRIPLGAGFVSCRHGTLPVPAPATLAILKNIPVYGAGIPHELVTPTGAAIVAVLAESFGEIPDMIIQKTGYGAGKHEIESRPNLLRIIAGTLSGNEDERVAVVETCIDDMNPEIFGFMMDRLFEDGALDVCWIPVFMKKNRPGTMIQVLCKENRKTAVIERILSESTSTGVRYYNVQRAVLARKKINVKTTCGMIEAKKIQHPDGSFRIVPEYEVCKKIALKKNIPIRIVYDTIAKEVAATMP